MTAATFPYRVEWNIHGQGWRDVDVDEHTDEPIRFQTHEAARRMLAIHERGGRPGIEFRVVRDRPAAPAEDVGPPHRDDLMIDRIDRAIRACERLVSMARENEVHALANGARGVAESDRAIALHVINATSALRAALRRCGA